MRPEQHSVRNLLLASLPSEVFAHIAPHLERVTLAPRQVLDAPSQPVRFVHFFESAICSTVARAGAEEVEVGICGHDGFSGMAVLHHSDRSPLNSFIQAPGDAWRIAADDLRPLLRAWPELGGLLLRGSQAFSVQMAYTVLANGRYTILQRMSRWLLMYHDRVVGDQLELTHAFLSLMLGVRRAGVTTDMHVLEGARAVINRRGRILVRNRAKLEEIAGECYGAPEAEYERLVGKRLRRPVFE